MRSFADDTAVDGREGTFRATLHEGWNVWGPFGGYRAAVMLRALAAASRQPRPATFACAFFSTGKNGPVEIAVTTRQAGNRAEALHAVMTQDGAPIMDATAWFVAGDVAGFEHDAAVMPRVPAPETLRSYKDLSEDYASWYPLWQSVEGRPLIWSPSPGPPEWHAWLRLQAPLLHSDLVLEAARHLMWLDVMMWNAVLPPHPRRPTRFIAPSLDLTAQFHAGAPTEEWLLCDAAAPIAVDGLASCHGRVWSRDGRLLASGTSQLFCRPNPVAPPTS